MIEKNCEACGDLIHVRLADHKRGWGRFCDKRCKAAHAMGERPSGINDYHASCVTGGWAYDRYHEFQKRYPDGIPPKAKPLSEQVSKSKRKVTPKYHSPSHCRKCGEKINGPGLCGACDDHEYEMSQSEAGWDGHKH